MLHARLPQSPSDISNANSISMGPSSSSKTSRITIACNSCRLRKQKCSGKRPVCTQCLQHHRQCDWPEQLKRGPAKGYIEALEYRLHETENLLLSILPRVSEGELSAITAGNGNLPYSPTLRQSKRGAEYWRQFPLDTVEGIRGWQDDCLNEGSGSSQKPAINPEARTTQSREPVSEFDGSRGVSESEYPADRPMRTSQHDMTTENLKQDGVSLSGPGLSAQRYPIEQGYEGISNQTSISTPNINADDSGNTDRHNSSTPQEPSSWSGAPSAEFQEQFLW